MAEFKKRKHSEKSSKEVMKSVKFREKIKRDFIRTLPKWKKMKGKPAYYYRSFSSYRGRKETVTIVGRKGNYIVRLYDGDSNPIPNDSRTFDSLKKARIWANNVTYERGFRMGESNGRI